MLLTLTVEQRVLLHLWDTPLGDNPWEGRPELTQAGVSEAVGIARKHLPRTLKKLREKDRIHEETRHVAGAKQRCRVYALSPEGRNAASELVNDIHTRVVKVDGEQTTVQSLHNHATGLLDVLRNIDSTGTYRPPIEGEAPEPAPLDGRDLPLDHRLAVYVHEQGLALRDVEIVPLRVLYGDSPPSNVLTLLQGTH